MALPKVCAFVPVAALAMLFSGCEAKSVTVKGKLLKNGQPMVVPADTYVTISFVPDGEDPSKGTSRSATFDQSSGTYTVDLPPGKYKTMVVISLPAKKDGKLSGPKPVRSETVHDLTKSQELDIVLPDK